MVYYRDQSTIVFFPPYFHLLCKNPFHGSKFNNMIQSNNWIPLHLWILEFTISMLGSFFFRILISLWSGPIKSKSLSFFMDFSSNNLTKSRSPMCLLIYTRVRNVCQGWPVYGVKCLCSRGRNERGRGATPTSISIFDSYGMKTFWFEFGYCIFAGVKMPRL